MWIFSSYKAKILLLLLLGLAETSFAKKSGFSSDDFVSVLGDLSSLESEEKENILKSLNIDEEAVSDAKEPLSKSTAHDKKTPSSEDKYFAEESKKSILIRVQPAKTGGGASHDDVKANASDKNYNFVQWHASPARNTEHHIDSRKLDSNTNKKPIKLRNNMHDMKAQETTYSTTNYYPDSHEETYDHSHDSREHHHDDHYHADHNTPLVDSNNDGDQKQYAPYRSQEEGKSYDNPSSNVFYKKMKLKKVRKNCTRSKNKKNNKWPAASDTFVHGRTNDGSDAPQYESKSFHSVPALPDARFNTAPKYLDIPDPPMMAAGFSSGHLHGVPRTHVFQYKDGEGVNHYHLHNHHYHVNAKGEKVRKINVPDYRNLASHFDKLKNILSSKEPGNSYPIPHSAGNFRSTLSIGSLDLPPESGSQKLGYHYTGSHESYGRKTYKRIYPTPPQGPPSPSSAFDSDKTFGMEMFRYGAGQYGTDEFSSGENKGPYPNEVTLDVDKPFSSSGEIYEPIRSKPKFNPQNSFEYNSDSPMTPYKPYSGEQDSGYDRGKTRNYHPNQEDKAPYTPPKAPYTPQTYNDGSASAEYNPGYGPQTPEGLIPPGPYSTEPGKSGPEGPPLDNDYHGNSAPPNLDITQTVSYSGEGDITNGPINFAPEAPSLYLRPGPDPLTIPKNARVFEHHIRLHPMHYNLMALTRSAMDMPISFSNAVYPVPLHKLIADPLKMPLVPMAPPVNMPRINQMFQPLRGPPMPTRYW